MKITTPLTDDVIASLHAGDKVQISGVIYVGRDAAHKRLVAALDKGEPLPFDARGQVIYYMGPSPTPPGHAIGSAGPTTAGRMDAYTRRMLAAGLKGMIGKGNRSKDVRAAIMTYKAVYFAATGGVAALISQTIKKSDLVAYPDLGAEAVLRLEVEDFPAIVVNDIYGGDAYEDGKEKYRG
jgi:fumarate hydratase subunit beta